LAGRRFEVASQMGLPPLRVDPLLISQGIFPLVENAAKYSGASTRIDVTVERNESGIRFAVTDEGPGILRELRAKVFQKFFRAGLQPGLGMGLAIARGIVQAHGGKIWIDEPPGGKGASVQFQVPLGEAA